MKILSTLIFLVITESSFCQVTLGTLKEDTFVATAVKPIPYDSLNDYEYRNDKTELNKYIGLQIYFPPISDDVYHTELAFWIKKGVVGVGSIKSVVSNKYYTILDIIYDDKQKQVFFELLKNRLETNKTDSNQIYRGEILDFLGTGNTDIIVAKDSNGDTLVSQLDSHHFILVPYFIKMKELYEGKFLIYTGEEDVNTKDKVKIKPNSRCICTEVTLLPEPCDYSSSYSPKCYYLRFVLKTEEGKQFVCNYLKNSFILENVYLENERLKKIGQAEISARKKQIEKEEEEKEKETREKRISECISKFGLNNGRLIAEGKVSIGMSKEMCIVSWGRPYNISKTTNEQGVFEIWYYSWLHRLYFTNGILKEIKD